MVPIKRPYYPDAPNTNQNFATKSSHLYYCEMKKYTQKYIDTN